MKEQLEAVNGIETALNSNLNYLSTKVDKADQDLINRMRFAIRMICSSYGDLATSVMEVPCSLKK